MILLSFNVRFYKKIDHFVNVNVKRLPGGIVHVHQYHKIIFMRKEDNDYVKTGVFQAK
jgi:hypothetical protein